MFQSFSYMKLNELNSVNTGRSSGSIIENDFNKHSGISRVITGIANDTERKTDQISHFFDTEKIGIYQKKSLLKHFLIGGTVLAGVGALAAGGVYYLAGRQHTGERLDNMALTEIPTSVESIFWGSGRSSFPIADSALKSEVRSTTMPEISLSPYYYYESINGSRGTKKQTQQQTFFNITDKPDVISDKTNLTAETLLTSAEKPDVKINNPSASAYMAMKTYDPIIYQNHDKVRTTLYDNLMGDYEDAQPLGAIFHDQISDLCYSELIKPAIEQAYAGDEKERCDLLNDMSGIIEGFIIDEILLVDENDQLKELTKDNYMEELIMKRTITTLIMAAEFIMENKNFDEFYVAAMKDYKQYSEDEIENKNSAILKYISENECSNSYEDSLS